MQRLLAPKLERYLQDLDEAIDGFKHIAQEARRQRNPLAEGAALAQIGNLCVKVAGLVGRSGDGSSEAQAIRSQDDLPALESIPPHVRALLEAASDWESIPPRARALFEAAFDAAALDPSLADSLTRPRTESRRD